MSLKQSGRKLEICGEKINLSLHDFVHLTHALLAYHDTMFSCSIVLYINGVATIYRNKTNNFLPKTKISDIV